MQELWPAEAYLPTPHPRQAVAPVTAWYCPLLQLVQEEAPVTAAYFPAGQFEQTDLARVE